MIIIIYQRRQNDKTDACTFPLPFMEKILRKLSSVMNKIYSMCDNFRFGFGHLIQKLYYRNYYRFFPLNYLNCLNYHFYCFQNQKARDFPGGAVVKNPPANAGDMGSIPGLGRRSHMPQSS